MGGVNVYMGVSICGVGGTIAGASWTTQGRSEESGAACTKEEEVLNIQSTANKTCSVDQLTVDCTFEEFLLQ